MLGSLDVVSTLDQRAAASAEWLPFATGYGADPTGDTNSLDAILAAVAAGEKGLFWPSGTYSVDLEDLAGRRYVEINHATTPRFSMVGAGEFITTINVGPEAPTFDYYLFNLTKTPDWFSIENMTINGPTDPTRGGEDYHDRNKMTCLVYNIVTGSNIRDNCHVRFTNLTVGGNFNTSFYFSNGDVDTRFTDCDITGYLTCMNYYDGQTKYTNGTMAAFRRSNRWLRATRTKFHDAGIPPWTSAEDAEGIADTTGAGHQIYPHPHVNQQYSECHFEGGVAGKYAIATHTGSVNAPSRIMTVDNCLFEGPGGGVEGGENGLTVIGNSVFDGCTTAILFQNDLLIHDTKFRNCVMSSTGSVNRNVKEVTLRDCIIEVDNFTERFDASMTSGSAVLTTSARSPWFTASLVGRYVVVYGAGASGANLTGKVSAFTDSRTITLDTTASTTVTNAQYQIGYANQTWDFTPTFRRASYSMENCRMFIKGRTTGFIQTITTNPVHVVRLTDCEIRDLSIVDGVTTTNGSPTATFTYGHGLSNFDIGTTYRVVAAGALAIDGTITAVPSSTSLTLSANATASAAATGLGFMALSNASVAFAAASTEVEVRNFVADVGHVASSSQIFRHTNGTLRMDNVTLRQRQLAAERTLRLTAGVGTVFGRNVRLVDNSNNPPEVSAAQRISLGHGMSPTSVASAATIKLNTTYDAYRVTGTTTIDNIYVGSENGTGDAQSTRLTNGRVSLVVDAAWATSSAGNVSPKSTAARTVGTVVTLQFDPSTAVWYEIA